MARSQQATETSLRGFDQVDNSPTQDNNGLYSYYYLLQYLLELDDMVHNLIAVL